MRIIFIGRSDHTNTMNSVFLNGFKRQGVTVHVVDEHITMEKITTEKDLSVLPIIKRMLRRLRLFPALLRRWKYIKAADAIFVGYPGHTDVPIAYVFCRLLHKPLLFNPLLILASVFSDDVGAISRRSLAAKFIHAAEMLVYRLPDVLVADTQYQKDYFHRVFGVPLDRIAVIPVGADDTIYRYRKLTKDEQKWCTVVYYGMYNPVHGTRRIVEAARLCRDIPTVRFLMVGNGKTYLQTVEMAKKYNLRNVQFFPDLTEKNALSTLQTARIFLGFVEDTPTVQRSIPNKVFQGMALGKAVITADAPVVRSMFRPGENIAVCKGSDARSLAQTIMKLAKDSALCDHIAERGYALYRQEFTLDAIGKQLTKLII